MKSSILFFLTILLSTTLWSQSNEDRLQRLLEDDPEVLNVLVSAQPSVQEAALEAATQPDVLSQIQTIQDRSRAAFESIVSSYSQETQQIFWDLTRYPNLIARLAKDGRGTESGATNVLRDYPEAIHARAREANKYYYTLLVKIDDLERSTNQEFNQVLNRYPRRTQETFRLLLNNPEILSALTQREYTTEVLANLYRNDRNWTLNRFLQLNQEQTQQSSTQLEDWRNSIQSDPEAAQQLTESAQAYAREYGYDDEYYGEDWDDDDYYDYRDNRRERVVVREYHYYHYPYWFGYPRWYRAPRWRPVPVWYDYGFVWRPNRPVIIVQMPSFYFVDWYFYRPWHHYRYARLSNCFVDYYYRHPRSYNSIVININTWKYRNRAVVDDNWLRDRDRRIERLREFGQFEEERRNYNRDHRDQAVSQRDYLDRNDTKYERLRQVAPRNADRNTFPERERTVETPRRPEGTTQPPRTRAEAHRQDREGPERNVEPREERRVAPTEQSRTRTRDEVETRESPQPRREPAPSTNDRVREPERREAPTRTPERNETTQPRREVNPPSNERTREPERREPARQNPDYNRERNVERQPSREPQTRPAPERPRNQEVERQRTPQPSREVERPRNNDAKERSKAAPTKREEAPRKRNGEG